MKNIAVYFTDPDPLGAPFVENDGEYARSYRELGKRMNSLGARFCVVRGENTFLGKGRFSKYWLYQDDDFIEKNEELLADVLLNKSEEMRFDDGTNVVNDPLFQDYCTLKEKTYELFSDLMPISILVLSKEELSAHMNTIPSTLIVVKPPHGTLGRGVMIGTREEVLAKEHTYPLLVQEFIDTSDGIPGIMVGTHDSRLVVVGSEFSYCEYKIPKKGSLISNVSLGGSYFPIPRDKIPAEELELAKKVDARFTQYPTRIYSIDMCRGKNGRWYIIELNAPPGLIEAHGVPEFERYHEMIAELLVAA